MTAARVLVAEDHEIIAELLELHLRKRGFEVDLVYTGREVLDGLSAEIHSVLLIDLGLPDIEGAEVIWSLKADPARAGVPVIAMTASRAAEERERAMVSGAQAHLVKPFDPDELARIINRLVRPAS